MSDYAVGGLRNYARRIGRMDFENNKPSRARRSSQEPDFRVQLGRTLDRGLLASAMHNNGEKSTFCEKCPRQT
jgi:hypothetical protein